MTQPAMTDNERYVEIAEKIGPVVVCERTELLWNKIGGCWIRRVIGQYGTSSIISTPLAHALVEKAAREKLLALPEIMGVEYRDEPTTFPKPDFMVVLIFRFSPRKYYNGGTSLEALHAAIMGQDDET